MKISGLRMLKTEIGRARPFGNVNLIGLNGSAELEGSFRGIYPLELKQQKRKFQLSGRMISKSYDSCKG